ncbi:MAG: NADH-quinone oxidoreductase subunit L [Planctomycetota bacterium]|nr:NADH-quinone oxidoreductase subunit L [Planctomycetota bacterium]
MPCWSAIAVSFVCSLILLLKILPSLEHAAIPPEGAANIAHSATSPQVIATGYEWFSVGSLHANIELRADAITAIMLTMVTGVSLLVAMFGSGYMSHDPGYPRFFAAVSLFVSSMCMLVLSGSFIQLFVFWEAVGLCSYLLIGFWFQKPAAAAAAKKAFVVNRIGDFGLIMGIFLIWTNFGSLDFVSVLGDSARIAAVEAAKPGVIQLICFCLFLGAMGKSAQFPLQVWLPDAMEGPTPVSALIHAATMVTAGIYLVARCTPLFVMAPNAQLAVSGIGAITAAIAALTALTQTDLKRVLAYSTVSQLGFMFMALGCGAAGAEFVTPAVTAGMFHLFTHAFFKALLFLAAGSVMHAMGNVIDMRRFSGLKHALPITHWTFLVGAAALAGFPLLAGFWSKDDIIAVLAQAAGKGKEEYRVFFGAIWTVAVGAAFLTAFYTFRAYFMTFWGPEKFPEEAGQHPHEVTPVMAWPLRTLAVCAAGIGLVVGPTHLFGGYLQQTMGLAHVESHGLHWGVMISSSIIAIAGIGFAWMFYVASPAIPGSIAKAMKPLYVISQGKFFLDEIFKGLIVLPLIVIANLATLFDKYVIDGIVDTAGKIPKALSLIPRQFHGGVVSNYAGMMWVGVVTAVVLVLTMF